MKKLVNDIPHIVPDALSGLVALTPSLALLGDETTVLRADIEAFRAEGKVALVTGGGAGHEPAHAGYVGRGMITAAVSGDVFASPGTDAVLAAIRAVSGPAGVLLIVKNYTGDRLNFGLAAEIARAEGIAVEMVIVTDDAALGAAEHTAGRRGIAGTVLVHKIAGAAAEAGLSLAEVTALAERAVAGMATMGVALSPCTVPAAGTPNFELGPQEIELGLGIHGEPGVERTTLRPARELVATLLERIIADRGFAPGTRLALMVNNLGATPVMEQSIVAGDALALLAERGFEVARAWCGTFLTAIDMAGISLTLLRCDTGIEAALDLPVDAPAWPRQALPATPMVPRRLPAPPAPDMAATASGAPAGPRFEAGLRAICAALRDAEPELTRMDQAVGDGDIGRSLAAAAEAVQAEASALAALPPGPALRHCGALIRRAIGGTSGPLYAILCTAAATALDRRPDGWAEAFAAGVDALCGLGGAAPGDRTMVDALAPARDAALEGAGLPAVAQAAREGAERTAQMQPRLGRSSYLGDRAKGHKDPGAEAVALWLEALAAAPRG
ncbi:dihydroxyacetone kinase subunit DhaK (plasmid) [Paroceanicella profunda]|uniref:Dihydroxyacetone kinase subunit DhaK n=1 Tax=Paroceanicella profunda TaxID=2579971 RepID=A0A5B8FJP0_9RHOB|nr:dihydroxyacetone kinase family protein [Paroceanicella profunda]QDL94657.1 dihydroxyacetone kinase subunit DhaK [Paroceanicella profunda]